MKQLFFIAVMAGMCAMADAQQIATDHYTADQNFYAQKSVADAIGNVYVMGMVSPYEPPLPHGAIRIDGPGYTDIALYKIDSRGKVQWKSPGCRQAPFSKPELFLSRGRLYIPYIACGRNNAAAFNDPCFLVIDAATGNKISDGPIALPDSIRHMELNFTCQAGNGSFTCVFSRMWRDTAGVVMQVTLDDQAHVKHISRIDPDMLYGERKIIMAGDHIKSVQNRQSILAYDTLSHYYLGRDTEGVHIYSADWHYLANIPIPVPANASTFFVEGVSYNKNRYVLRYWYDIPGSDKQDNIYPATLVSDKRGNILATDSQSHNVYTDIAVTGDGRMLALKRQPYRVFKDTAIICELGADLRVKKQENISSPSLYATCISLTYAGDAIVIGAMDFGTPPEQGLYYYRKRWD